MSLRAMLWALEHAPVENPARLVVLLALADCAADDGTAAWPTQERLAARARCSTRSVRRYLKDLEEVDGVIRRGDQELVAHFRRDLRPVVWDLVMDAGTGGQIGRPSSTTTGQTDRADSGNDRTAGAERPDRAGQNDRTLLSTEQSFFPYGEETVLEQSGARKRASRLPKPFPITDEMRAWARADAPKATPRDHDQFCDYWWARAGKDATKLDWFGTWRNWMRKESDSRGGKQLVTTSKQQATDDQFARAAARMAARSAGGER